METGGFKKLISCFDLKDIPRVRNRPVRNGSPGSASFSGSHLPIRQHAVRVNVDGGRLGTGS
jgi:hypothetical protein